MPDCGRCCPPQPMSIMLLLVCSELQHTYYGAYVLQKNSRWDLLAQVRMQGYGVVGPALGLDALRAAMTGQLARPNVVVNPFQLEKFLAGGYNASYGQ